jgi:hypothetical protein
MWLDQGECHIPDILPEFGDTQHSGGVQRSALSVSLGCCLNCREASGFLTVVQLFRFSWGIKALKTRILLLACRQFDDWDFERHDRNLVSFGGGIPQENGHLLNLERETSWGGQHFPTKWKAACALSLIWLPQKGLCQV